MNVWISYSDSFLIFSLTYLIGTSAVFKFVQFKLFKIRFDVNDRVPSSVIEVARIINFEWRGHV